MWSALMRHRGWMFAGALFVLPVVLLYAQTRSPKARGPVVGVIVDVAGFVERGLLYATGGLSDFLDEYVYAMGNAEELARLRQNAMKTKVLQAEIRELEAANEQLRSLAQVAARIDGPRPVGARVIGRSGAPLARIARIDRGRRDGVKRGDGVISSGGVVGRVLDAGYRSSDVLLATDPASAIDVVVQRTRARGIVRGKGETKVYEAEVQDFDRLAEISPGDTLVTSGLDPALPPGLYVGELLDVKRDEDGLYQRARVQPGANLAAVERVLVLISRQPSRRPQLAKEDAPVEEKEGVLLLAPNVSADATNAEAPPPKEPPKLVPKRPAPAPPAVKPAATPKPVAAPKARTPDDVEKAPAAPSPTAKPPAAKSPGAAPPTAKPLPVVPPPPAKGPAAKPPVVAPPPAAKEPATTSAPIVPPPAAKPPAAKPSAGATSGGAAP